MTPALGGEQALVWAFFGVQLVSVAGHAAASLVDWADWADKSGAPVDIARRRLKLLQGLAISLLAGNACYYGSSHLGVGEIPGLLGSGIAAYGGDRFLTPLLTRLTGRTPG